ncbi:MAG: biotin--[acetyl-CoA-carboxylase] ligase [Anaerolineae bacterium]|nr:biotin--[acetyl-CoA-carboxylase] ligase [Anaerolineae bacterium]
MDEFSLRKELADEPQAAVKFFRSVGSTNDVALAWAEEDAPDWAVVAADHQSSGRGRLQRRWVTEPGSALAFSVIFRPTPQEIPNIGLFSPLGGLGVARALESFALRPLIKWPNDVLLDGRKVCGILAEAVWQGPTLRALVLGVGVNVAPKSVPPDDEVQFPATCVETVLGRSVYRADLMRRIMDQLKRLRPILGTQQFMRDWEKRLAFKGQRVRVSPPGAEPIWGELVGLTPTGGLHVELDDGKELTVDAGDVSLRSGEEQ